MDAGSSLRLRGGRAKGERGPSPSRPRAGWRGLEEGWRPGRRGRSASSALTLCPAVVGSEPTPPRPRVSRRQAPGAAAMPQPRCLRGTAPTAPTAPAKLPAGTGHTARHGRVKMRRRRRRLLLGGAGFLKALNGRYG